MKLEDTDEGSKLSRHVDNVCALESILRLQLKDGMGK